jgi:flagellar protein FliL
MSAESKTDSSSSGSASGGGNKLVMILTLVNLVVVMAMAGILFVSFQKDRKQPTVGDISADTHAAADAGGDHGGGHGAKPADAHGGGHGGGSTKKNGGSEMLALDQFTVNLSTPGGSAPKFVRVNIALEVANEESKGEVAQKMPQVRNSIIDLFNSKRPADLGTTEGREMIKKEIKEALNGFMVSGKVKDVFFTNFAVSG